MTDAKNAVEAQDDLLFEIPQEDLEDDPLDPGVWDFTIVAVRSTMTASRKVEGAHVSQITVDLKVKTKKHPEGQRHTYWWMVAGAAHVIVDGAGKKTPARDKAGQIARTGNTRFQMQRLFKAIKRPEPGFVEREIVDPKTGKKAKTKVWDMTPAKLLGGEGRLEAKLANKRWASYKDASEEDWQAARKRNPQIDFIAPK